MKAILIYFLIFLLCYFVPAFVNFDINAGNWNQPARLFVLLLFGLTVFLLEIKKDIKK